MTERVPPETRQFVRRVRDGRRDASTWKSVAASLALSALVGCATPQEPRVPLGSGDYIFTHRFAEHPDKVGTPFTVRIEGRRIVVTNDDPKSVFPVGRVAEGTLMWHPTASRWIIGTDEDDLKAKEVGGCSDGPTVVDLVNKVYWSC
jgi:hypothetical protein